MHNFEYLKAFSTETVAQQLKGFFDESVEINSTQTQKPKILEIFTPSKENDLILKEYFKYIK